MKTKYTQAQLAALAELYRTKDSEYRKLDEKAEEYLSEGNYVRRDNAMEDAGNIRQMMRGIQAAAESIGIPPEELVRAAGKTGKTRKR